MGFSNQSWIDAAMFCATNKVNLEEALEWAEYAISGRYIGVEDFNSLQAKAVVLTAMGKETDAEAIMAKAINLPSATVQAVHQYGRSLLASGKTEKALEVFKLNQKKYPGEKFTTNVGLARAYTALGDKKNAIKHWELALKNIPENQKANLAFYEGELKKLKG
jgi:tetratricopeptide (TPR) repeat protein